MNRLIIIGNGFDLAHQMKTKYFDFIDYHIRNSFQKAMDNNGLFDDKKFIKVETNGFYGSLKNMELKEILEISVSKKPKILVGDPHSSHKIGLILPFKITFTDGFFEHLINSCCDYNWVDIENEYYNRLKPLLEPSKLNHNENRLKELNDSMGNLIVALNDYLTLQKPLKLSEEYNYIFQQPILKDDIALIELSEDQNPEQTLILNFNYTNTINEYYGSNSSFNQNNNITVNNIHGQVNDQNNPIIFGYGDELDSDFAKIESDKRKGFLKYMKSYFYQRTSNYQNLFKFLQLNHFQVFILGHSCGLSDRTMLNMIFEHNNCKSIKIFYHQTKSGDDYRDKTEEMSRHFHNKGDMRIKIVPWDKSSPMPQIV